MTPPQPQPQPQPHRKATRIFRPALAQSQRGVVLIISLVMLIVVSLLAVTSMHTAVSSEAVAGNARTTALAAQSAEIALRHCESSVLKLMTLANGDTKSPESSYPTDFTDDNIQPASDTAKWVNTDTWDGVSNAIYVVPLSLVNQSDLSTTTYKRPPECLVEPQSVLVAVPAVMAPDGVTVITPAGTTINTTSSFIVTARGFGPEVAAVAGGASRPRPVGSEFWLQSQIHIAKN